MSRVLEVAVKNKIATAPLDVYYICGNSDFIVNFDFDDEWDGLEVKTARFVYGGKYTDVVFIGNQCAVPIISDTYHIQLGVFAGNLHTTTAAWIPAKKSVLCGTGFHTPPSEDVYNQIMEQLNRISSPVKTVNGIEPDANGNVQLDIEAAVMDTLFAMNIPPVILDADGAILTDADGAILLNM